MEILLDAPSIAVTQALLVLSLYEWGNCSFHKAWMYCGELFLYVPGSSLCTTTKSL